MKLDIEFSIDPKDLDKVMNIVKSFGADDQELVLIKDYIGKEFKELGDNRTLFFLLHLDFGRIGCLQIIHKNADSDTDLADGVKIVHVHALQIHKDHRRKGFATEFMLLVESHLKKLGITKVTLGVDSDNLKAIRLYDKLGYSQLKTKEGRSTNEYVYYNFKNLA